MNITDLRAVVDLIEGDPLLRDRNWLFAGDAIISSTWDSEDVDVADLVRALHGTIDSPVKKRRLFDDDPASAQVYERKFGAVSVAIWYYQSSTTQHCELVQTGTRIEQVPTAFEEREVPVFEYRCGPVLAFAPVKNNTVDDDGDGDDPF